MPRLVLTRSALAAALLASAGVAPARDVPTGVDRLALRLDGTLRYNLGLRADPVDDRIAASPVFTGGETSVAQGGVATNRLDLLAELDLAWDGRHGARVSGVGWYDHAYQGGEASVGAAVARAGIPSTYVGNRYSTYTLRRYRGPWGELLDAFAFGSLELGSVPLTLKAGRHTVVWGESLMQGGAVHGVSYAQAPLDLAKAFATPGIDAKELYRPLAGVSAQAQLLPTLSLAGQLFLEWQPYVYPEGGTFLGPADFAFEGPDGVFRAVGGNPAFLKNGGARRPRDVGDFGVALRWSPEALAGTIGLYYRRYTDKLAAVLLTDNPGGVGPMSPALPSPYQYRQYYGEDADLLGLSFARQVLGASLAAEVAWRRHAPLLAQSLGFAVAPSPSLGAALFPSGLPRLVGNTYQARGDTLHAVVNALGVAARLPGVDAASWAVEVTYSRWLRLRENPDLFFGEGHGVCRDDPTLAGAGLAKTRRDGCATRDHVAVGASLSPTWYRVFSGVDLLVPLAGAWTVRGNSAVTLGGNEGSGSWSAGVAADVRGRYRLDLRYADFFGRTRDDGRVLTSANGLLALLHSRANVTLTAKATF